MGFVLVARLCVARCAGRVSAVPPAPCKGNGLTRYGRTLLQGVSAVSLLIFFYQGLVI